MALGNEDRVVAEAVSAAGRKGECPIHAPLDGLAMTVRPAERERTDEIGRRANRFAPARRKFRLDTRHRHPKFFSRPRPSGRIDAGRAVERRHDEAGIVGKGRLAAGLSRCAGLERRVRAERVPRLLGLREAERRGTHGLDAERPKQRRNLAGLACVMARHDQARRRETTGHAAS